MLPKAYVCRVPVEVMNTGPYADTVPKWLLAMHWWQETFAVGAACGRHNTFQMLLEQLLVGETIMTICWWLLQNIRWWWQIACLIPHFFPVALWYCIIMHYRYYIWNRLLQVSLPVMQMNITGLPLIKHNWNQSKSKRHTKLEDHPNLQK